MLVASLCLCGYANSALIIFFYYYWILYIRMCATESEIEKETEWERERPMNNKLQDVERDWLLPIQWTKCFDRYVWRDICYIVIKSILLLRLHGLLARFPHKWIHFILKVKKAKKARKKKWTADDDDIIQRPESCKYGDGSCSRDLIETYQSGFGRMATNQIMLSVG